MDSRIENQAEVLLYTSTVFSLVEAWEVNVQK